MMNSEEYLIATVGELTIGVFCKDVRNVFNNDIKITRIFYQSDIYLGITEIHGQIMHVIDLRKRLMMNTAEMDNKKSANVITFQTSVDTFIALTVDSIIGLKSILTKTIHHEHTQRSEELNIHLLFPTVANLDSGEIIHLLDVTYLEKTEHIPDEFGDLELF